MERVFVRLEPCAKFGDQAHGRAEKRRPSVPELEGKRQRAVRRAKALALLLGLALGAYLGWQAGTVVWR